MNGRIVGGGIVGIALIAGGLMYYLQVYAYYDRVSAEAVTMQMVPLASGTPEPILVDGFQGIDATSSPLRFRGCFTTPMSLAMLTETYEIYDAAEPLTAPGWFDCFDAGEIGAALEDGGAVAFLSTRDIADGIDRVIAVYPDGRAFAWHQLNEKYRD